MICTKIGVAKKIFKNEDPYILCVQICINGFDCFVIGVYLKSDRKDQTIAEIKILIKRIRNSYKSANIALFGDFNTNSKFTIKQIRQDLHLNVHNSNLKMTTRQQSYKGSIHKSTLDYFLYTSKINQICRLAKMSSDHYPLLMKTSLNK